MGKGMAGPLLEGLRVVPDGDALHIARQSMAGALVVPAFGLVTAQLVLTSAVAGAC